MTAYFNDEEPGACAGSAEALAAGDVVLCPTDTQYGLHCDAANPRAADRLRALKGYPAGRAILALAPGMEWAVAQIPGLGALPGLEAMWPGPFTVLCAPPPGQWSHLVDEAGKLAVRVPGDAFLREVLGRLGRMALSTSANPAGIPYRHSWRRLRALYHGRVSVAVHRRDYAEKKPSALLDWDGKNWIVLREGPLAPPH